MTTSRLASARRTLRDGSRQCLCFDLVRFSEKPRGSLLWFRARNVSGALPVSDRGAVPSFRPSASLGAQAAAAARLTAAPFWGIGIGAVPPPAALAGCQSLVSGTRHTPASRPLFSP